MKILIIPDSFKGSASNIVVAEMIAAGVMSVFPEAECCKIPFADGGEGSLESIEIALGGDREYVLTEDPLRRSHRAFYLKRGSTGYLELAQASGLQLLKKDEINAGKTTTLGTGNILKLACQSMDDLIFCIGGSATNDAGCGIAYAIGYRFLDVNGHQFLPTGDSLHRIEQIIPPPDLPRNRIRVLCDVKNPLTGPQGATFVYATQKGAGREDLQRLEAGMKHFQAKVLEWKNVDLNMIEGAGAAGGVGGGLVAFFDAELVSGIEYLMEHLQIEEKIQESDLIFTGEGKIDQQTVQGKLISGIAKLALKHRKPVIALCGSLEADWKQISEIGLTAAFSIVAGIENEEVVFAKTPRLIKETTAQIVQVLKCGKWMRK